ncbi:hypothetical protein BJ165DRAFT_1534782 [Panaeolus papilionaceus]|nr:hypothetical protein BJ165DRAFT_1534782 [Panaeolus papilionaceus]
MPLLSVDPNTEVEPSYDTLELVAVLQARLQPDKTLEQVIVQMKSNWAATCQHHIEQWNQQEADRLLNKEQERQRLAAEEAERKEERERAREQAEKDRKKVKVNTLAKGRKVETTYATRPTQYALQKIKNFDYIELYYFTPEGCKDRVREDKLAGDCAVAASHINNKIVLQSIMAQMLLLEQMDKVEWPAELVLALRTFFYKLSNNSMYCQELGPEAVILYQAQVRKEWWDTLKVPGGEAFNIGIINKERLEKIYTENLSKKYLQEEWLLIRAII